MAPTETVIVQAKWEVEYLESREADFANKVVVVAGLRSDAGHVGRIEVSVLVDKVAHDRRQACRNAEREAIDVLRRCGESLVGDINLIQLDRANRLFLSPDFGDIGIISERLPGGLGGGDGFLSEEVTFFSVKRRFRQTNTAPHKEATT